MEAKQHLVIITGHSSGLGRALLDVCLQDETHVLGIARRRLDLQHPHLKQIQADLGSANVTVEQWFQPLRAFLDPDVWKSVTLVNNAGTIKPVGFMGQLNATELTSSLHANLTIPLQLTNWILQNFPQQRLRVAQVSSGAAHKAYAGWGAYCSSKAGLRMVSQVLATEAELTGRDLCVLVYEPGVMDTAMQQEVRSTQAENFPQVDRFRQLHSAGKLVPPAESARVLWQLLCSKDLPRYLETRYGAPH